MSLKKQLRWERKAKYYTSYVPFWQPALEGVVSFRTLHLVSSMTHAYYLVTAAVQSGADVNAVDTRGNTALHVAAAKRKWGAVEALLKHGADINKKNIDGKTAPELLASLGWKNKKIRKAYKKLRHLEAKSKLGTSNSSEMKVLLVDRVHWRNLSYKDFIQKYAIPKKPVVIEGYSERMFREQWSRDYFKEKCYDKEVNLVRFNPEAKTWGNLEFVDRVKLGDWLSMSHEQANGSMVFDYTLPINCHEVMSDFIMPKYFSDDYIQKINYEPSTRSFPSLFMAHGGTKSGLHIDAWGSNFWMMMIAGRKHFRTFSAKEAPLLYPNLNGDTFTSNVFEPNYKRFPLLKEATAYDAILGPNDMIFVPAGNPHQVRNLDDNMAISGNYIDKTSVDLAIEYSYICTVEDNDHIALYEGLSKMKDEEINWNQEDMPYAEYRRGNDQ